jgi:hypothetical protein
MKLFANVPDSFFTPERARELQAFAEKAGVSAATFGQPFSLLSDIVCNTTSLWFAMQQEEWALAFNPIKKSQGNLDFLAACIAQGTNLKRALNKVVGDEDRLFDDLRKGGLHGFHFRMDIAKPHNRVKHTFLLVEHIFKADQEAFHENLGLLGGLSTFRNQRVMTSDWSFAKVLENTNRLPLGTIEWLLSGSVGNNPGKYQSAFNQILREGDASLAEIPRSELIHRIEKNLIPLVYNVGYRLKAEGLSNQVVKDRVSVNIDALLHCLDLDARVRKALQRQILVNLFSPFPDGLKMMRAKPEELQGALLDPVWVDHADAEHFQKTLIGPLALFGAEQSTAINERRTKIIEYFKGTPYELDFKVAIHGLMAKSNCIVDLFSAHCDGHSAFLEEVLCGQRPAVVIEEDLLGRLLDRNTVKRYSDQAVLAMVELLIKQLKAQDHSIEGRLFLLVGTKSLDLTFKDRPHLRDPVLQLLLSANVMSSSVFRWCDFDHRELKTMGRLAPPDVKKYALENALGL